MVNYLLPIACLMFAASAESSEIVDSSEYSEPESSISESEAVVYPCSVSISDVKHGKVYVDSYEGYVGDPVTVTAEADTFYVVSKISVNGSELAETDGAYVFEMAAGVNMVSVEFEIDEELLGSFSSIISSAENGDWTSVFSMESVLTIVKWLLDGGILIAIARYFIKDKKLAKQVETTIQDTMNTIVPDTTKQAVLDNFEKVLTPMVSELQAENSELAKAMAVFAKCMALSQENTAESRKAIIDELSSLKIADSATLGDVKKYIEEMVQKQMEIYKSTMDSLSEIEKKNEEIVATDDAAAETKTEADNPAGDDGTQI